MIFGFILLQLANVKIPGAFRNDFQKSMIFTAPYYTLSHNHILHTFSNWIIQSMIWVGWWNRKEMTLNKSSDFILRPTKIIFRVIAQTSEISSNINSPIDLFATYVVTSHGSIAAVKKWRWSADNYNSVVSHILKR